MIVKTLSFVCATYLSGREYLQCAKNGTKERGFSKRPYISSVKYRLTAYPLGKVLSQHSAQVSPKLLFLDNFGAIFTNFVFKV